MPDMEYEDRKWRDREALRHIITQWNANRLDLFSLSEPNEVAPTRSRSHFAILMTRLYFRNLSFME